VASTDVPKAISSSGTPLVTSTVSVSIAGRPTIYDLDVRTFLRHTNASNIDMTLQSPAGTVVTLTTDNGGTNDNVFDGTVWDDDANPGGQIPYSTNNGLATDHNYLNGVTASPLAPEEALGAFNGEDPNGTWTLTISDDLTLDGGVLDDWSITMATIDVAAPSLATAGYTATGLPISIDDFTPLGRPTTKTIAVSGAGSSIWKVTATTGITHTNNADLDVTLRSPQGTIVTLTTDNGGSFDNTFANVLWDDDASPGGQVPYTFTGGLVTDNNYANQPTTLVPEEGLAAFRGENPNGTWTLTIWDDTAGNTGNLNSFALNITTAACPESCVVDCNDQDGCTSDSCNPSLGCVHGCTGGASCIPGPIANIGMAPDKSTIVWDHATGGASSAHDLVRGQCGQFPVGTGAAETCLASALAATTAPDSARPPVGAAFWYDVRGHHVCGDGPYGLQTGGAPRTTGACP
jgi:subtilisin-like proprotein convertase family protein